MTTKPLPTVLFVMLALWMLGCGNSEPPQHVASPTRGTSSVRGNGIREGGQQADGTTSRVPPSGEAKPPNGQELQAPLDAPTGCDRDVAVFKLANYEPIDPKTVAAWESAGATLSWVRITMKELRFEQVAALQPGGIPTFTFISPIPPATLARLPQPTVPFGVRMPWRLPGASTKDADGMLKELGVFSELQLLDLSNSDVTDQGLLHLPRLKGLRSLHLGYTDIRGKTLDVLAKLEKLTTLSLRSAEIFPDVVSDLAACKQLVALDLSQTRVSDDDLRELKRMVQLRVLVLHATKISDDGVKALSGCEGLRWLTLSHTSVTGAGLRPLAAAGRLELLDLFACRELTDEDLSVLGPLGGLHTLNLGGTVLTDRSLTTVGKLKRLRKLGPPPSMTDAGLKALAGLSDLCDLDVTGMNITDAGMKELAKLAGMKLLTLRRTSVGDEGLKDLSMLTELRLLEIGGTKVTDRGLEYVGRMTRLEELELSGLKITDDGLKALVGLTRLRTLHLQSTRVTDDGLRVLWRLKELRAVYLEGSRVTPAGVAELKSALPGVRTQR